MAEHSEEPKNPATVSLTFRVEGMDCASCARSIESAVAQLDDVENCEINFTTEILRVTGPRDGAAITRVVSDLGYRIADPIAPTETEAAAAPNFWQFMWQRTTTRLALFGAVLMLPGLLLTEILGLERLWINALSLLALLLAGWPVAHSAWRALRVTREININVLMTIAAVGAVIIGAFVEAAMVMVLFSLGEALEGYTTGRARHAIRSLMELAPRVATRLRPAPANASRMAQEQVSIDELVVHDVILVRPGERIPMDGRILAGASAVNQAAVTGESRPIDKTPGDELFAGSVNGEGALEVEVTHLAADNTIQRMIRLVEAAQEQRAPTQRFIDRFARIYTPAVVVLALLVATVPPLLFGQPFWNPDAETFGWFYRGLALLVVACPCALVISTPVTIISAISNAARHGVLVKGGVHLEVLSRVKAVAFDKTGTLTLGRPMVTAVRAASCEGTAALATAVVGGPDCMACEEVLALAGAVEARSEHPLAHAVVAASAAHGLDARYPQAENVAALTGRGVVGRVGDRAVFVGSHGYFDANIPHSDEQCRQATADARLGHTPMMVGADDAYLGTITVADTVRTDSARVVAGLKEEGIGAVAMLTGDEEAIAQRVAAEIGVTDVRAGLLPEDKVAAVQELRACYGALAMVGDGINDAPALAVADVGIAVGGAGATTQAMETADITLMSDDLQRLPYALRLSRAAMGTIRANVIVSLGIKLLFLVLVLLGLGTMWMAVLADVGTSVLVTLNGMRLLRRNENGGA